MSKSYKDRPEKYNKIKSKKPKEGKRFAPTKGRKKENIKHNLEDYFI